MFLEAFEDGTVDIFTSGRKLRVSSLRPKASKTKLEPSTGQSE